MSKSFKPDLLQEHSFLNENILANGTNEKLNDDIITQSSHIFFQTERKNCYSVLIAYLLLKCQPKVFLGH